MGQKVASLEIELLMATASAVSDLVRFGGQVDRTTADSLKSLDRIDKAMAGMGDMSAPTAGMVAFAAETAKSALGAVREIGRTEAAIDRMIATLDRQTAATGRTKEEQRAARVEELAITAARQGNTDAADRLLNSMRNLRAAQEALAKDRLAAETLAVAEALRERERAEVAVIDQLRERSRLEAALNSTNGVDRPRATDAGATFSALSARAAEDEARAVREATHAYELFEKRAREGAATHRMHEAAASADAASVTRLREMLDPAAAAQSRFNDELTEARRVMTAAGASAEELARVEQMLTGRMQQAAGATGAMQAGYQQLSFQISDVFASLASGASPVTVFGQQASQVVQALSLMGGPTGAAGASSAIGDMSSTLDTATGAVESARNAQGQLTEVLGLNSAETGRNAASREVQVGATASATRSTTSNSIAIGVNTVATDTGTVATTGLAAAKLRLVTFMTGPWGAAAIGGVTILGMLASKYMEASGESDDLVKKMKEEAEQAAASTRAREAYNATLEGQIELQKKLTEELDKSIKTEQQLQALKVGGAAQAVYNLRSSLAATNGQLIEAEATAKRLRDDLLRPTMGATPESIAVTARESARAEAEVTKLKALAANARSAILDGERAVREARLPIVEDRIAGSLDAGAAATQRYTDALGRLREERAAGLITEDRFFAQDRRNRVIRDDAIKAAQEATKVVRDAETLTSAAVAKMLRGALPGVAVTSTTGGKHVPNSYHYKNQAVDFVPKGGMDSMTKADVRKLFESRGIDIVELLGPGDKGHSDHFHVAWTKGKLALDEFSDAAKRAKKATEDAAAAQRVLDQDLGEVTSRFDPARKAAADLVVVLEKIASLEAAGRITPGDAMQYAADAVRQAAEAKSKIWNDRATSILGIEGDPLGGIVDQFGEQQQEDVSAWVDNFNASLTATADRWDEIATAAQRAGQGMSEAFGSGGRALGDMASTFATYRAEQERSAVLRDAALVEASKDADIQRRAQKERKIGADFAARAARDQIGFYGDMASAAKGFFKEGSTGYQTLAAAEKVFRAVEFALSVRAMAQDAIETGSKIAKSIARTAVKATEAVVNAISSLPFPLNIAAGAATIAAIASLGVSIAGSFGGGSKREPSNTGTGTVLGDADAKSESLKRSIDLLREVDTLMLTSSRQMASSLRSIDDQIGGFAAQIVRTGDIDASAGVKTGFKTDMTGKILSSTIDPLGIMSKIPLIGGVFSGIKSLIGSLFGSKTSVVGTGLYGGAQSVGSILDGGYDASYFSDVQKKKKFFGITTGTSYSTKYGEADAGLEQQFTLILKSFSDAIGAAAGPLGQATADIQARLNGFVVDIGKIDLKDLTGAEIQEKLEAVFGAAADGMAEAAFPGVARFQKAGEGAFETLVRVASTLEAVSSSLDLIGGSARGMSMDAKLGLADQFDSIGDLTGAVDAYFTTYFSEAEQAAAETAQMGKVFASLGVTMPDTLASFRALVEAQDLTTAAGQATYATLLQLAPAFADLKTAMDGAKSAADILSERQDLERRLLELRGDTAAIRALDLAKLDASNRGLQMQIYAVQDAQEAAKAAETLRDAWKSVGDTILDEVKRIRGITDAAGGGGFASLMGQFNAANVAARGGDQDAAKSLPGISQALLKAAADAATSRQELDRIQAATAATLEATYGAIASLGMTTAGGTGTLAAAAATQAAGTPTAANDDTAAEMRALREELAAMRADNNAGHAATAGNTGKVARKLDDITAASGGDAISTVAA